MSHSKWMEKSAVNEHLATAYAGVVVKVAWGEKSYFYNPGQVLKRGTYFATIKEKDGENDRASNLVRPGIWRLNMGVSKETYRTLFGPPPARPAKGGVIEGPWDFAMRDVITPHPVYGWMGWVAVLSPSEETWRWCMSLLEDAHGRAKEAFEKRTSREAV